MLPVANHTDGRIHMDCLCDFATAKWTVCGFCYLLVIDVGWLCLMSQNPHFFHQGWHINFELIFTANWNIFHIYWRGRRSLTSHQLKYIVHPVIPVLFQVQIFSSSGSRIHMNLTNYLFFCFVSCLDSFKCLNRVIWMLTNKVQYRILLTRCYFADAKFTFGWTV